FLYGEYSLFLILYILTNNHWKKYIRKEYYNE
ncbi:unnamed protein product, partial [marine sediment metagenome]